MMDEDTVITEDDMYDDCYVCNFPIRDYCVECEICYETVHERCSYETDTGLTVCRDCYGKLPENEK